ncbi:MAG: LysR family transcriptional regulator [Rhizobiaceae bacterium]
MENIDYLRIDGNMLRLFLAIFDSNSVSVAADQLDLNQSTVSYSLDKMRSYLGDPLFIKDGRGITPTKKAIDIAPKIAELLANLEGLTSKICYEPTLDSRPIAMASNVLHLLPQWSALYEKFTEEAPNLPIRMLDLGAFENVDSLLNGAEVDLVFEIRPEKYSNWVNAHEIHACDRVCFYDPNCRDPIESVEDYCEARHAVLDFGGDAKSYTDALLEQYSLKRNITLYAPNVDALAKLALGTDQIITFNGGVHSSAFQNFAVCETPIPMGRVYIDMIWHRKDEFSGRNSWIRDIVKSCLIDDVERETP